NELVLEFAQRWENLFEDSDDPFPTNFEWEDAVSKVVENLHQSMADSAIFASLNSPPPEILTNIPEFADLDSPKLMAQYTEDERKSLEAFATMDNDDFE